MLELGAMRCVFLPQTQEALARAKERLQYAKDTVLIPRNLAGQPQWIMSPHTHTHTHFTPLSLLTTGKVIGKRGDIIQVILEKSKVNNVRVVGDEEAKQRNLDVSAQV